MAERLLKKKPRKVAPKKAPAEEPKRVVLVGTNKEKQLTEWRGWYNYPISDVAYQLSLWDLPQMRPVLTKSNNERVINQIQKACAPIAECSHAVAA